MKVIARAPCCILFDAVGTLIYADPPVADVYHAAGTRFGSTLDRHEINARFRTALRRYTTDDGVASGERERHRWRAVVAEVFRELPDATGPLLDELWTHFSQPTSWSLFDDAAPTLDALRCRGHHLGLATNFDERIVGVAAGHAALANLPLFWSSDIGYSKPHPQFFARVAEQLQLAPHEIMLIGDDKTADVYGALAAGWQAMLLDRAGHGELSSCIATLAELPGLLASLAVLG